MANQPEFVLVIDRNNIFTSGFTPHGFFIDEDAFFDRDFEEILEDAFFMERDYAEYHPQYKQIIPYTIIESADDSIDFLDEAIRPIFAYRRTTGCGEVRLHDKFSIGIGGHINPEDIGENLGPMNMLLNGLWREIHEELDIVTANGMLEPDHQFIGFINQDTTPVGAVHLGVVSRVVVKTATVRETGQIQGRFVYPHQLGLYPLTAIKSNEYLGFEDYQYESWSKILIDSLFQEAKPVDGTRSESLNDQYVSISTVDATNIGIIK